ncbi:MAG: TadE/TadG family type IV pilus assembly protein [Desulfotomaculales bacterium]
MRERGSIMVETALAFVVLLFFTLVCVDLAYLIADKVHLQRVAREAAREAAITNDVGAGKSKGMDLAGMYFGKNAHKVMLDVQDKKEGNARFFTATAGYRHKVFGGDFLGWEGVSLGAKATFGWWDFPHD